MKPCWSGSVLSPRLVTLFIFTPREPQLPGSPFHSSARQGSTLHLSSPQMAGERGPGTMGVEHTSDWPLRVDQRLFPAFHPKASCSSPMSLLGCASGRNPGDSENLQPSCNLRIQSFLGWVWVMWPPREASPRSTTQKD
jgi:hypothetical protein